MNTTNIGAPETDTLGRLERLRNQILRFRLCYRFSYVSYISLHNAVSKALRETFGLDHMLHELDGDTAEITAYLEQVVSKQTAHRFRRLSALGAAGLGFLTTFAIVKEGLAVTQIVFHDTAGFIALGPWLAGRCGCRQGDLGENPLPSRRRARPWTDASRSRRAGQAHGAKEEGIGNRNFNPPFSSTRKALLGW